MPGNITLTLNGTATVLPWSTFISNIEATSAAKELYNVVDTVFVVQCACISFFMQAGFLLLETGSISNRNKVTGVLLKNIGDTALCAFFYYIIGHGLSAGDGGPVIGTSGFAGHGSPMCSEVEGDVTSCSSKQYALLFFKLSFATSAGTIMSGAIAERMSLPSYYLVSVHLSCWIYPFIARWLWHEHGWASIFNTESRLFGTGALDFAGGSAVHMTGSIPALILLPLIGPRRHRFTGDARLLRLPGQNVYFTTIGTMILWLSWYGFVCGSTGGITGTLSGVVSRVACNTTISAAVSSLVTILLGVLYDKKLDSGYANTGIIAGLVGITSSCATVDTVSALVIGAVSACVYFFFSKLLLKAKLDDVVDCVPTHFCCGFWGMVATAVFSKREYVQAAYPHLTNLAEVPCGLLYTCNGLSTKLLAANLVYMLALVVWAGGLTILIVIPLWYFNLLHDDSVTDSDVQFGDDTHVSGDEGESEDADIEGMEMKCMSPTSNVDPDQVIIQTPDDAFVANTDEQRDGQTDSTM